MNDIRFYDFICLLAPNVAIRVISDSGDVIGEFVKVGYRRQYDNYLITGLSDLTNRSLSVHVMENPAGDEYEVRG